ncbi:uncharacterized protein LOC111404482 [Olea europaea var. sylvestris]|uniref:uncharacterized protein LOC111404482 n=1 Tax=Olea europaea var. sylvestris TaxID=158386 RepID=UPI000C1D6A50|nr:uncharacterized protein LOC111404482 [Olea europaea var. sylvestris]
MERPREGHMHRRNRQAQKEASIHEIDTIFGGPYVGGETRNTKRNYVREAKHPPLASYIVDSSSRRNQVSPIVFTQEDAEGVHYPHCDALVVRAVIARNGFKRMLVDNGSLVNILFGSAFDKMILDHQLTPTTTSLYEFTGDSITPRGKITLAVEMGDSFQTMMNFMENLIVDSRSAYNGVEPRDIHVIIADIVMADVPGKAPTEPEDIDMIDAPPNSEVLVIDEIDPCIIELEPQASPVEELESFSVDPRDPSKVLKVGKGLSNILKEKIKDFFSQNIDIFAWKHEEMVGIDPKFSCHHLKIDPKVDLYRQKRRALNPERYEALKEEVQKLIQNDFIREATYPSQPGEIEALYKMRSPQKPKEVQSLIGRVATLNRFVSKITDKCLPFFKVLKVGKKFQWNEECEEALQGLKRHLGQAPLLSKPKPGETLQLYLTVSNEAISSVLTREEGPPNSPFTIQVLQKPDASGRLLKWAVELSEFDLVFKAGAALKGQALADFVAEFTNLPEVDEIIEPIDPPTWNLFVDGSAGDAGSGAGVVLISPEGHKLNSTVRFGFKATNNVAEYEALLAGLRLTKEMQVKRLLISSNSQLVVSQVNDNFSTKDKTMTSYLKMVMNLIPSFDKFELTQIPRIENSHANALSKLASSKDSELLMVLPTDKLEAYKLRRRSAHFLFIDNVLYKRSFSSPLLRCVGGEEANYTLREVHEGVYGNHSGGLSLVQKILRQGYYWPILKRDTLEFVRKCDKCQRFSSAIRNNKKVRALCEELGIKKHFSTPHHPQANGQVEAVNKTIKHVLKRKLDVSKRAWVDELPQGLWAIRTTTRTPTGETHFLMAFETEAMSPVEVGLPSPRRLHFSEMINDELRRCDLDFIVERSDDSQSKLGTYQRKMSRYFNSKVKKRSF